MQKQGPAAQEDLHLPLVALFVEEASLPLPTAMMLGQRMQRHAVQQVKRETTLGSGPGAGPGAQPAAHPWAG